MEKDIMETIPVVFIIRELKKVCDIWVAQEIMQLIMAIGNDK